MDEKLIKSMLEYGRRRFSKEHWDTDKTELDFMAEEVWKLIKDKITKESNKKDN